jgi:hypothetical protein
VPGGLYGQTGQPWGQVPFSGAVHVGPVNTPEGTSQQSIPGMQHCVPQQNSLAGHTPPAHGGAPQWPPLQYGCAPPHVTPHPPQLRMSLPSFTQPPLQHSRPGPQAGEHVPPLLDELAVVDEPLPMQHARHPVGSHLGGLEVVQHVKPGRQLPHSEPLELLTLEVLTLELLELLTLELLTLELTLDEVPSPLLLELTLDVPSPLLLELTLDVPSPLLELTLDVEVSAPLELVVEPEDAVPLPPAPAPVVFVVPPAPPLPNSIVLEPHPRIAEIKRPRMKCFMPVILLHRAGPEEGGPPWLRCCLRGTLRQSAMAPPPPVTPEQARF